jgi:hypothetical protein
LWEAAAGGGAEDFNAHGRTCRELVDRAAGRVDDRPGRVRKTAPAPTKAPASEVGRYNGTETPPAEAISLENDVGGLERPENYSSALA